MTEQDIEDFLNEINGNNLFIEKIKGRGYVIKNGCFQYSFRSEKSAKKGLELLRKNRISLANDLISADARAIREMRSLAKKLKQEQKHD
jgi:hypothetical protein